MALGVAGINIGNAPRQLESSTFARPVLVIPDSGVPLQAGIPVKNAVLEALRPGAKPDLASLPAIFSTAVHPWRRARLPNLRGWCHGIV